MSRSMPEGVRLQKVIADAGIASRRQVEELIAAGRVAVDGQPASLGQRVDPATASVTVDGRLIEAAAEPVHVLLAKPAGVTSTVRDRHAARTVVELVPPEIRRRARRLYPVGRLDRDSEGLILLTNDGEWAERVLHPRHEVEREYAVGLAVPLTQEQQRLLLRGIDLDEGRATLSGLRRLDRSEISQLGRSIGGGASALEWYSLVLRQGWKRQVRRMFFAVGARVERLVRVRLGGLQLDGMRLGDTRLLSAGEAAGLAGDDPMPAQLSADRKGPLGPRRLVIAVDGPGGSGKSSVGARAASRLGYRFCDTGVLYRGLTWLAVRQAADVDDAASLLPLVPRMELAPDAQERYVQLLVDGGDVTAELHTADVDRHVSQVSRHAEVRAALLPIQRGLAAGGGIIMAGRDIGTVVLPDADLKVYLDVSIEERTRRRALDRGVAGDETAEARIAAELRRRDGIDSTREAAPLRIPPGAVVIRTEGNTLEQTVDAVVELIRQAATGG
jgi:cytidylate kinase